MGCRRHWHCCETFQLSVSAHSMRWMQRLAKRSSEIGCVTWPLRAHSEKRFRASGACADLRRVLRQCVSYASAFFSRVRFLRRLVYHGSRVQSQLQPCACHARSQQRCQPCALRCRAPDHAPRRASPGRSASVCPSRAAGRCRAGLLSGHRRACDGCWWRRHPRPCRRRGTTCQRLRYALWARVCRAEGWQRCAQQQQRETFAAFLTRLCRCAAGTERPGPVDKVTVDCASGAVLQCSCAHALSLLRHWLDDGRQDVRQQRGAR